MEAATIEVAKAAVAPRHEFRDELPPAPKEPWALDAFKSGILRVAASLLIGFALGYATLSLRQPGSVNESAATPSGSIWSTSQYMKRYEGESEPSRSTYTLRWESLSTMPEVETDL